MSSPEFQVRLEEAKAFRINEANVLRTARGSGLKTEAVEYLRCLKEEENYVEAKKTILFDRWEKLGAKIPEFSNEAWEETGQVLSGINNGVKAGLFLEIAQNTPPDTYMPVDTIVERFKKIFQGTELLEAFSEHRSNTKKHVMEYSKRSLCDVGLLTEEYKINERGVKNIVGHGVTERGRKIGIPIALSVLWYENKTNQSLYPALGQTSSNGETRAPSNKAWVLDYLVRHPYGSREADLVTTLGIPQRIIGANLKQLRDSGMIDYKAIAFNTGITQIRYEKIEGKDLANAALYPPDRALQNQIIKILQGSVESISGADVLERFPDEFKQRCKTLKDRITSILSYLSTRGYLARVDGFKGGNKQSDVFLIPKGRDLYTRIVYPALLLSSGGSLSETHLSHLHEASNNLSLYACNSAELYYPHSASNKIRKFTENRLKVLEILRDSPDSSFTTQELSKKMGLGHQTMSEYLKPQVLGSTETTFYLDGELLTIQKEKIKGVWYFSVKK